MENRVKSGGRKSGLKGCLFITIGIPLLILLFLVGLWGLGGILVIADRLEPADAIVVLSGGDTNRVKYAANLYNQGYGEYLILTETGISYPGNPKVATQIARELAMDQGVPETAILASDTVVQSTSDEAKSVLNTSKLSDFQSIIIITDPYHTFRTRMIFQTYFRTSGIHVMVHPDSEHWYDSATWFLSRDGWATTLSEYVKIGAFVLGIR